jgi:hypothetical protein
MKSQFLSTVVAAAVALTCLEQAAQAGHGRAKSPDPAWHGGYYEPEWGMPLALVVPPNAEMQAHYGWGVGATRTTPIFYQYQPGYPNPGYYNRAWFQPVPPWPSSTDQLGVYYIRGPW